MKSSLAFAIPLFALMVSEQSFAEVKLSCDAICDTGNYRAACLIKIENEKEFKELFEINRGGGLNLNTQVLLVGTTPSPEMCDSVLYQSGQFIDSKSVPVIGPVAGVIGGTAGSVSPGTVYRIWVKYAPTMSPPRVLDPSVKTKL